MKEDVIKIKFQIKYDKTKPGDDLYVTGEIKELGNWKSEKSQKLYGNNFPTWESEEITFKNKCILEFKFFIKRKDNPNIEWENFKGNRKLDLSTLKNGSNII